MYECELKGCDESCALIFTVNALHILPFLALILALDLTFSSSLFLSFVVAAAAVQCAYHCYFIHCFVYVCGFKLKFIVIITANLLIQQFMVRNVLYTWPQIFLLFICFIYFLHALYEKSGAFLFY